MPGGQAADLVPAPQVFDTNFEDGDFLVSNRFQQFNRGAQALHEPKGKPIEFGVVRPGLLADLVIVPEDPVANLKVLYGTGAVRLNEQTGKAERVGGIRYTIKDGIVYDARQLLADVARMVEKQKAERGITRLPGTEFPGQ